MAGLNVLRERVAVHLSLLRVLCRARGCSSLVQSRPEAHLSSKQYRYFKNNFLRQNRRDPSLEEKARLKKRKQCIADNLRIFSMH